MPEDAKAPVVDPYAKLAALAAKTPVEVPDGPTPPGSAEWARWFGTEEVEGDNLKKHHEYQGHGGGYPPELAAYFVQCRVEGARWNDKTGTLDDQGDFGPTEALLDAIRGNKLAVLDLERLAPEDRARFDEIDFCPATLTPDELGTPLPEPHPSWMERLEEDWTSRYGVSQ